MVVNMKILWVMIGIIFVSDVEGIEDDDIYHDVIDGDGDEDENYL
jgi:hypothetical protein